MTGPAGGELHWLDYTSRARRQGPGPAVSVTAHSAAESDAARADSGEPGRYGYTWMASPRAGRVGMIGERIVPVLFVSEISGAVREHTHLRLQGGSALATRSRARPPR